MTTLVFPELLPSIPVGVQLDVVSLLAKGNDNDRVASKTRSHARTVDLCRAHWGPDLGTLARSAEYLRTKVGTAPTPDVVEGVTSLLDEASRYPRLADKATQVRRLLNEIHDQIMTERARVKLEAEIADAAAKLADARTRLAQIVGEPPTNRGPLAYDPKIVRAWARGAEIDCPATGRVPADVVAQWRTAVAS